MNLNEYKDHFCSSGHLLPAIALYPTQQNWKCLHIRNRQYTEFHISNFWSRRSLGRKPHNAQKIKLYSVRALKRQMNERNLIHSRVMATISKFSPQISETYFKINKRLYRPYSHCKLTLLTPGFLASTDSIGGAFRLHPVLSFVFKIK